MHSYLHANECQKSNLIMTEVPAVYQKLKIRQAFSQMINKLVVKTWLLHAKTGDWILHALTFLMYKQEKLVSSNMLFLSVQELNHNLPRSLKSKIHWFSLLHWQSHIQNKNFVYLQGRHIWCIFWCFFFCCFIWRWTNFHLCYKTYE